MASRWGSASDRRCSAQSHAWAKPGAARRGSRGCPGRGDHVTAVLVADAPPPHQAFALLQWPRCPFFLLRFFAGEPQAAGAVVFGSSDSLLFPAGMDPGLLPASSSPPLPWLQVANRPPRHCRPAQRSAGRTGNSPAALGKEHPIQKLSLGRSQRYWPS